MRTGGHLSTNTLASAMLALLYAIQEDQGAEVAKAWLRARLLSVVDVEDPDWSIVWRPAVSEFCAARSNTPPQVYTAGRKRFYALPASPFELATEIVYLLEDGMVRRHSAYGCDWYCDVDAATTDLLCRWLRRPCSLAAPALLERERAGV